MRWRRGLVETLSLLLAAAVFSHYLGSELAALLLWAAVFLYTASTSEPHRNAELLDRGVFGLGLIYVLLAGLALLYGPAGQVSGRLGMRHEVVAGVLLAIGAVCFIIHRRADIAALSVSRRRALGAFVFGAGGIAMWAWGETWRQPR